LTWTKGIGNTNTMIRYSEADYPADETGGIEAYFGILESYTITGLSSGHNYYIVAIGNEGANYTATVEVLGTTSAAAAADAEPGAPDEPTGLFQDPDYTLIPNIPGYEIFNQVATDLNVPLNTMWMYIILSAVGLAGFLFYKLSHNLIVTTIVIVVGIAFGSLIGILPLWMMFLVLILGIGLTTLEMRRVSQ